MRSDKQVEASAATRRGNVYRKIAAVFDMLPERFKPSELYKLADLPSTKSPQQRIFIASILERDFKCVIVAASGKNGRYWKKPGSPK